MTLKQKIRLVEKLVATYKQTNQHLERAYELFGNADSPFCNTIWQVFDEYVATVGLLVEDTFHYIDWYIHEAKCGEGGCNTCIYNKRKYRIDSVKKLIFHIERVNKP